MKKRIEIEEIKKRRQALNMSLNPKGIFLSSGFGNQASFNVPPHSLKHKKTDIRRWALQQKTFLPSRRSNSNHQDVATATIEHGGQNKFEQTGRRSASPFVDIR